MKFSEGLKKLLSFGYLFLILTGILKESVLYYQLDITILKYSTITDILISPIADLATHPVLLVAVIVLFIISYAFPSFLSRKKETKWVRLFSGIKEKDEMDKDQYEKRFSDIFVTVLATALLTFFIGIGLGEGEKISKKIKSNQIEYNNTIHYINGSSESMYLVGSNSLYYFYLTKGSQHIKISPVGAIQQIELAGKQKKDRH